MKMQQGNAESIPRDRQMWCLENQDHEHDHLSRPRQLEMPREAQNHIAYTVLAVQSFERSFAAVHIGGTNA